VLLQHAADGIRGHLRSHDFIVRIGGDEFLCVIPAATIKDAEHRFNVIQTALAADSDPCEIKVGLAALEAENSAAELIRRADTELPVRPPALKHAAVKTELTHDRSEVASAAGVHARDRRGVPVRFGGAYLRRLSFFIGPALAAAERRSTDEARA
jgi:GGDEF domain-containing protein